MDDAELNATVAAEQACSATTVRFFHFLDRGKYEALAGLLTENCVWLRQGQELAGRTAVLDKMRERAPGLSTRHLLSNIVVDLVSEREAHVGYELTVYARPEGKPARLATIMTGEDTLERTEAGWCIRLKKAQPVFSFPD